MKKRKLKQITNWNDLFKIKIRELTSAQTKHLVVKAIIVQQLLIKYRKDKNYLRIYTEFPVKEGKICDIYFENFKTKEVYAYEIQSLITKEWLKEITNSYENWEVYLMKTGWVLVELNKLSDNIEDLTEQIKELII